MAKIDGIKDELGWLKIVFAVSVAVDISWVGWIAQNFGKAQPAIVVVAVLGVAAVTGFVVWVNRLAYRRLEWLVSVHDRSNTPGA